MDDERIQRAFDTNVFGVVRTSRAVIPHMAARKSGTIVNIGSFVGELYVHTEQYSRGLAHPMSMIGPYLSQESTQELRLRSTRSPMLSTWNAGHLTYPSCSSLLEEHSPTLSSANFRTEARPRRRCMPTTSMSSVRDLTRMPLRWGRPLDRYARELVGKVLRHNPPRYFGLGAGSTLVWLLRQFPRGFVYRLLWNQMVEKPRAALTKVK